MFDMNKLEVSILNSMSCVLKVCLCLGTKATWIELGKHHVLALNTWFYRHKHRWKMSPCLIKNIQPYIVVIGQC